MYMYQISMMIYADDLSEEEVEQYKGMSEEDLEEEGIIWYNTVVE